ncbi:MAG TPA: thioredoxin [Thermoguttaceae bacterium]|nr:thioredoxin [Anaerolineales bacterium]
MSNLHEVNSESFDKEVLKSEKPVLVEFGAVWCQPCRILEPVLEELAKEWGDSVKVAKLDVDEATQLTMNYQVLSVPTTMLFKNGEVLERMVGYQPKDRISGKVMPHVQTA